VLRTLDRRALDLAHERLLETLEEVCRDAEQAAGEQEAFVEGVVAELARPLDEVLRCAEALGPRPGDTWRAEAADALQAATLRLRDQIGSIVHRVHVRRTALEFDQRLLIELGARRRTEGTAGGA
jgi:light-regulated signal transduction histidine kinase (bacteriophytochrome)